MTKHNEAPRWRQPGGAQVEHRPIELSYRKFITPDNFRQHLPQKTIQHMVDCGIEADQVDGGWHE